VQWDVETHSVSILRRMQVSPDVLKVGDRVRIAGNPGRRSKADFFAHSLLLPGGQEVLLQPEPAELRADGHGCRDVRQARDGEEAMDLAAGHQAQSVRVHELRRPQVNSQK
jgi:hypothetical protein